MKKLLFIIFLLVSTATFAQIKVLKVIGQQGIAKADSVNGYVTPFQLSQKVDYVADITGLENYTGNAKTVIVQDTLRGGVFNYASIGTADNGVVFNGRNGYWKRQYETSTGVNISWFGAKPKQDISDILYQLLFHSGYNIIVIPSDTFYLARQVGYSGDFVNWDSTNDSLSIKRNVSIKGVGNANITYTGVATQAMIELSAIKNLVFKNLDIDGGNLAVNGIYVYYFTSEGNFSMEDCTLKNFFLSDGSFAPPCAIWVAGNVNTAYFNKINISNVSSNGAGALGVVGINLKARGTGYIKNLIFTNNQISNVYYQDTTMYDDQEALYYGTFPYDTLHTSALITGNTFKNCRTRFIKVQAKNTIIKDNLFILDSMYVNPSAVTVSVDMQYSDGIVSDNKFYYRGYSHEIAIGFTNRDTSNSRILIIGNKIKAFGSKIFLNSIVQNYNIDNTARLGNFQALNNTVDATSNYFATLIVGTGNNKGIINGNRVSRLTKGLVNTYYAQTTTGNSIDIVANDNTNIYGSAVPISTTSFVNVNLKNERNIGFSDSNYYATTANLTLKANDNAVVHLTGNETISGTKNFTAQETQFGNGSNPLMGLSYGGRAMINMFLHSSTGYGGFGFNAWYDGAKNKWETLTNGWGGVGNVLLLTPSTGLDFSTINIDSTKSPRFLVSPSGIMSLPVTPNDGAGSFLTRQSTDGSITKRTPSEVLTDIGALPNTYQDTINVKYPIQYDSTSNQIKLSQSYQDSIFNAPRPVIIKSDDTAAFATLSNGTYALYEVGGVMSIYGKTSTGVETKLTLPNY